MTSGPSRLQSRAMRGERRCARAGCRARAVATLRFPSIEREASLVDLDPDAPRSQGDLCARHAATVSLPPGWALHDERTAAGSTAPAVRAAPERAAVPTRPAAPSALPPAAPITNGVTYANGGSAPCPANGASDDDLGSIDLEEVLDARTPLLQRAFRNALPRDA